MDRTRKEKIGRFLDDTMLSKIIYDVLLERYLKPSKGDVQTLAASRIAIDLLNEAWKDLEKYRNESRQETKRLTQIAL